MAAHEPAAPVDQLALPAAGAPAAAAPQPDPHQALQPLLEAAARTRAKVAVLRVPMGWQGPPWLPRLIKGLIKQVLFLWPHIRLAAQLWRRRDHDLIVVREFLTALLIIVWPLIWPLRGRVHFLINHNLQEAHRRGLERRVLRLLHRTGCRFACFETTAGFAELGIIPDAKRFLVIPHPLPGGVVARPAPAAGTEPTVGVIGEVRAEKGSAGLLETLLELRRQGRLPAQPAARLPRGRGAGALAGAWLRGGRHDPPRGLSRGARPVRSGDPQLPARALSVPAVRGRRRCAGARRRGGVPGFPADAPAAERAGPGRRGVREPGRSAGGDRPGAGAAARRCRRRSPPTSRRATPAALARLLDAFVAARDRPQTGAASRA